MKLFDVDCWPNFYYIDNYKQAFSFRASIFDFAPDLSITDNFVKQFKNHLFYIDNISKITCHKLKHIFREDFERLIK
jgi:RNase adaptor protein for sRNA GlmZ degradation